MKSFLLYSVFSMLFSICLYAVTPYSKGYVVDNKNDTIYGLLEVGNNSINAQKCMFKDSVNLNEHIYSPEDINSYRFSNGKYYVSKSLTGTDGIKKVFMECLVKGIVDIYYYSDKLDGRYFVDKGDGILVELKNTKFTVVEDDKTYQRNKNEYIAILSQIFQDSPKTCDELMSSELDYKSLTKLVVDYHKDKCTSDQCVVYEKKTNREKARFGIILGLNGVSLTRGKITDREEVFRNIQLNSLVYPSIGVYIELKFPYINNELLFAQYEASFWQEIHTGTTIQTYYSTTTNDMKDTKFNFKNQLLLKYDLSRGKFRPFVETGFYLKFALSSKFELTRTLQYDNSPKVYIDSYSGASPFLVNEIGLVGGVGLKYKVSVKRELFIDLRYNWGGGVISDNHFNSNIVSLNFGLQLI